jgi:antitoxin VapB
MAITHPLVYTHHIYKEITMVSSKLFLNNTTQAVRLPKEVAFPDDVTELEIVVLGANRVLIPKGTGWQWWLEHAPKFVEDVAVGRDELMPLDDVSWGDK